MRSSGGSASTPRLWSVRNSWYRVGFVIHSQCGNAALPSSRIGSARCPCVGRTSSRARPRCSSTLPSMATPAASCGPGSTNGRWQARWQPRVRSLRPGVWRRTRWRQSCLPGQERRARWPHAPLRNADHSSLTRAAVEPGVRGRHLQVRQFPTRLNAPDRNSDPKEESSCPFHSPWITFLDRTAPAYSVIHERLARLPIFRSQSSRHVHSLNVPSSQRGTFLERGDGGC